jgi:hypothetical protein
MLAADALAACPYPEDPIWGELADRTLAVLDDVFDRFRRLLGNAKGEAAGHALRNAGRLQSGIDAIHAVVAFDHLAHSRIPLRRAPGAGRDAALAADAETVIDMNDAILFTPLHGARGAGPDAPRILAMKAGHEDDAQARLSADVAWAHGDNLARVWAGAEILVAFAVYFAGQAGNAARFVVTKDIGAHRLPPFA